MQQVIPSPSLPAPTLAAGELARTPRYALRAATGLLVGILATPFIVALVPWTQTSHGSGQAIAFNPVQRPQFLVSPIEGRIKKWYVVEGQRVRAGDRVVEMVDNDPNLELRLLDEERAILDRLRAAEGRVLDIEARIRNLETSRQLAIAVQSSLLRQEQARVLGAEQERIEAQAVLDAAEPNYKRQRDLYENSKGGLASQRDLELALQALETGRAKLRQAGARVDLAKAAEKAAQDNLEKVDADTAAALNLEAAAKRAAEAEVAGVRRDKAQIEVRIARQRAQYISAPIDGVVLRLLANAEQGGQLVRPGERLAVLVPDIKAEGPVPAPLALLTGGSGWAAADTLTPSGLPAIVAELFVSGNDLPLIRVGDKVRLQFEGWPAVQFAGWPSVAVGTFGGRVYLVDPTSDDKGQFRLLIEPDPDDIPWPGDEYLRQGVRAQGWVLLNRVSVGWEVWRQLNGFPPYREPQEPKGGQSLGPVGRK